MMMMTHVRFPKRTVADATRRALGTVLLAGVLMICASCESLSQEQILANEQSRVQQERKGYFDRESSAAQKKAEEHAAHEALRRKK
jgi:hypothetical protein